MSGSNWNFVFSCGLEENNCTVGYRWNYVKTDSVENIINIVTFSMFISKSTKKACPNQILKASEPVSMEKNQEEPELTGITDKYGCY